MVKFSVVTLILSAILLVCSVNVNVNVSAFAGIQGRNVGSSSSSLKMVRNDFVLLSSDIVMWILLYLTTYVPMYLSIDLCTYVTIGTTESREYESWSMRISLNQ